MNDAEMEAEFRHNFKKKILDNEDVMKKIHKAMKPFFKIPVNSDVVKKAMAAEMAEIFIDEMEKDGPK